MSSHATEIDDSTQADGVTATAVLLDRQPLWLGALASVLGRHQIATLAMSTRTSSALRDVELLAPTTFVLDPWIEDEDMTGIDLIGALRERAPMLKIVGLGSVDAPAHIDIAFAAGADAYVLKVADPEDVAHAIKHVCSEFMFFAAPTGQRIVSIAGTPAQNAAPAVSLTKRELEILRIVAEGRSNGEIAAQLWVTEQTVKFHLSNIYRKLGVSNRTEAGRWAHLNALVSLRDEPAEGTGDLVEELRLRVAG